MLTTDSRYQGGKRKQCLVREEQDDRNIHVKRWLASRYILETEPIESVAETLDTERRERNQK